MNHAVTTILGCTVSITGPDAPSVARRLAQAAEFQAQTDRMNAALDAEHEDQPDGPGPLVAAGAIAAGVAIVASFIAGFSYQFFWG